MCNFVSLQLQKKELEKATGAKYKGTADYDRGYVLSGFATPLLPAMLDEEPGILQPAHWGLVPAWVKEDTHRTKTLNARIETAEELPSYRDAIHRRCVVAVEAFHEWKWLDDRGKRKDQYYIHLKNQSITWLGGLYSTWQNPRDGRSQTTFTLVTTEANALMAEIHNRKRRMPIVLDTAATERWLAEEPLSDFAFPNHNPVLQATNLSGQLSLF